MDDSELLREAFRPLAGAGLFRGNVFRLTGLAPEASAADVRRRRSQVQAAARLGLPAPPPAVPVPAAGPEPSQQELSAAFDELLRDPVRRFVHEVLWLWGGSDELAVAHDAIVRVHCTLLAQEWPGAHPVARSTETDRRWSAVLGRWAALLAREQLWQRLGRRAEEYADPRVTPALVAQLRCELPRRLLAVNVEIAAHAAVDDPAVAGRHVAMLRELPFPTGALDEVVQDRVRAARGDITRACAEASGQAGKDPSTGPALAGALIARTRGPLRVLAALLGSGAVHDEVASTVAGICVDHYQNSTVGRPARAAAVRPHLQAALELAGDRHVREQITATLQILERDDAVLEEDIGNGMSIRSRPGPADVAARVRAAKREREDARWAAMLAEREERLRREREQRSGKEGGEAPRRRERVAAEQRGREREEAERRRHVPEDVVRRRQPAAVGEPGSFSTFFPVVLLAGAGLGLVVVAVAFVAAISRAPRVGAIQAGAVGWGVAVACAIVWFAWNGWGSLAPLHRAGWTSAAVVLATVLALLVPAAGVAALFGVPWLPWGLAMLVAGGAGVLVLLVVGFWDPWSGQDARGPGVDPAIALAGLVLVTGLPMFGPGIVSLPTSYDDGDPRNGFLAVLGVAVLVSGLGTVWLQARRTSGRRWWRALGTAGWLGFGTGLVLLTNEAAHLAATFLLVTTPAAVLLGHGLRPGNVQGRRRLALLVGSAVLLPPTLLTVVAAGQGVGYDYWGAYGTETVVIPGPCVHESAWRYGELVRSQTTCGAASWRVGGETHTGDLLIDGGIAFTDTPVRAFVLGDQAYDVQLVGSISPAVVVARWIDPRVLLVLLPLQVGLLGSYLMSAIRDRRRGAPPSTDR